MDKPFEAWPYGPVIEEIHHDLKRYGSNAVTEYIKDNPFSKAYVVDPANKDLYQSIDISWEKYIGMNAVSLSTLTHERGSPWDCAKEADQTIISDETIKRYFVGLVRQ